MRVNQLSCNRQAISWEPEQLCYVRLYSRASKIMSEVEIKVMFPAFDAVLSPVNAKESFLTWAQYALLTVSKD